MLFVPVIPHHEDPPSPRTRELADLLGRVIQEYEKGHPSVTGREVRAALEIAVRGSRSGAVGGREAVLAGLAIAAAAAGVFVWVAAHGGSAQALPTGIAAMLVAIGAVVVVVKRARGG